MTSLIITTVFLQSDGAFDLKAKSEIAKNDLKRFCKRNKEDQGADVAYPRKLAIQCFNLGNSGQVV